MSAVDEVKTKLDIVEVVESYVRLQKAGRYFKANCPFHNEKTPSFYVYPDRQAWHCFGACATGGDVISFISRKENLDFSGALRLLAERAGVVLQNDGPRRQQMKSLQDANEAAALFYHGLLQSSERAQAYISERGLDTRTVNDFQLGYAPPGWETLRKHLTEKGYTDTQLVEAGLLVEGERSVYDRFRDRLIIPIRDERGRIVGFGGRVLPGGDEQSASQAGAKYVNTPQSPLFDKSGLLYGLDRAREEIRRQGTAVIVEGYMDVIAAHQHGHRNVVASMGTALTEKQAQLLQRFVPADEGRVVLAMDADEAGKAANLRAIQVVAGADRPTRTPGRPRNIDIRVMALPRGKDPDELIRNEPDAWLAAIEAARPVVDHLIAVTSAGLDLAQPRDRSQLVSEVLPAIGEVTDPVLRAHYLQRLSRLARVSEEALRAELPRRGRAPSRTPQEAPGSPRTAARSIAGLPQRERFCLALLYGAPELREIAAHLTENHFHSSENRELFRRWRDEEAISEDEELLWEAYLAIASIRVPYVDIQELQRAFLDCVERLEQVTIKAVKEASALALAEGEVGVRPGQVASIARARMGAGAKGETLDDAQLDSVASQLLEDMEAGLRFHRRLIEGNRSDQSGKQSAD